MNTTIDECLAAMRPWLLDRVQQLERDFDVVLTALRIDTHTDYATNSERIRVSAPILPVPMPKVPSDADWYSFERAISHYEWRASVEPMFMLSAVLDEMLVALAARMAEATANDPCAGTVKRYE